LPRRILFGLALLVCLPLQAFAIFRLFRLGQLGGVLPWDDCLIVEQSLRRLELVSTSSTLAHIVRSFRILGPHSAIADGQTFLGLALTGGQAAGAYALNVWALLAALAAVLLSTRKASIPVALGLTALLVTQPISSLSLIWLKADMKSGVLMAAALFVYYQSIVQQRRKLGLIASGLLGAAILCKLTAFYLPVLAVLVIGLVFLAEFWTRRDEPSTGSIIAFARARRLHLAQCVALAVAPFAVFFAWAAVSSPSILDYIRYALAATWDDGLGYVGRALRYGPGRNEAWGLLHLEVLSLGAAALIAAIFTRDKVFFAFLTVGLVIAALFFLPLVAAGASNPEFSGTFLGVVVGLCLVAFDSLASPSLRRAVPALLVVTGFALLTPLSFRAIATPEAIAQRRHEAVEVEKSYRQVASLIAAQKPAAPVELLIFFEDEAAPYPNLSIFQFEQGGGPLFVTRIDQQLTQGEIDARIAKADYLLTLRPSDDGAAPGYRLIGQFSNRPYLAQTEALVAGRKDFVPTGSFPWKGGQLRLYRRAAAS
jgi:hypothetical protein